MRPQDLPDAHATGSGLVDAMTPDPVAPDSPAQPERDAGIDPRGLQDGDARPLRRLRRGRRLDDPAHDPTQTTWLEPGSPSQVSPPGERPPRQLHPLPRGLVELYGLLAVLFVLVPEWMASGALFGFREGRRGSELPTPSGAWQRLPELRLASLDLAELRQLAHELGLIGYGRQCRRELTARLLRRLKARR